MSEQQSKFLWRNKLIKCFVKTLQTLLLDNNNGKLVRILLGSEINITRSLSPTKADYRRKKPTKKVKMFSTEKWKLSSLFIYQTWKFELLGVCCSNNKIVC